MAGDARVQRQASGDAGHLQRPATASARHANALIVAVVRGVCIHRILAVRSARYHADRVRMPADDPALAGAGALDRG